MLCRPLHTKTALRFGNATSLLNHLPAITISSKFRVDEEVCVVSQTVAMVERWRPLP